MLCLKTARWVANSVVPDQMPRVAASNLVYTVCTGLSVQTKCIKFKSCIYVPGICDSHYENSRIQIY